MNCNNYKSKNKLIKKCEFKLSENQKCDIIKRNRFLEIIMGNINYFLCLEYKNIPKEKKTKLQKKTLNIIFKLLNKKKNFLEDIYIWKQLYNCSVNIYKYENDLIYNNKNNKLPIYQVSKHNHCLSNIINEILKNKNIKTILHFDTHSDMNLVDMFDKLDSNYNKIIKKNDVKPFISRNEKIVWDIGAHVTACIYFMHKYYGINNNININWIVPDWVPIKQLDPVEDIEKQIFKHKNIYIGDEDNTLCYIKQNKNKDNIEVNFKRQRFNNKSRYNELINFVNNSEYILDIDLDYFVSNGELLNKTNMKKFIKNPFDVSSDYRYIIKNNTYETPRDPYWGDKHKNDLKKMKKEVKFIKKRMNDFLKGIKYMNDKNCKPIAIIICDSTNVELSNCLKCASESNCYVPHEYAYWIHKYIKNGLEQIFY